MLLQALGGSERNAANLDWAYALFVTAAQMVLTAAGMSGSEVDNFACHTDGAKVIIGLDHGALDHKCTALADYGDMSARLRCLFWKG